MSNSGKKIIKVPSNKLIETLISNRYQSNSGCQEVIFDISEYNSFLEPKQIVVLASFIEEYLKEGVDVEIIIKDRRVESYLNSINLLPYAKREIKDLDYRESNKETSISLWNITNTSAIQEYADFVKNYFESFYFEGESLESLHISLSELFNNIFDHSNSKIGGFVHTQYYPNLDIIRTAVCDLGDGIPKTVNDVWMARGKSKLKDHAAIRAAIIRRVTSKSMPGNKGFGLSNIFLQVNALNGEGHIVSGDGYLKNSAGNNASHKIPYNFPGTLVYFTIDVTQLPDEEDYSDETFSFG